MADGDRDQDGNGNRAAQEAALSARLRSLGDRLGRKGRGVGAGRRSGSGDPGEDASDGSGPGRNASALARGFRLSTELVAGVLVGAFIGWALDAWLGTRPWGMIVFFLLGFAAGVVNVMRAAGVMRGPGQTDQG